MSQAQPVLDPPTSAATFLILTVKEGGEPQTRTLLSELASLTRAIGFGHPTARLTCVAGIGSLAWDRITAGAPRPPALHPFRELAGPRHRAVSTPGDLLFHIRAERQDLCFALTTEILKGLSDLVTVEDEVQAFSYLDSRNLLGFVDGTENPVGPVASETALIGVEEPGFEGGSHAVVQKYLHEVDAWDKLSVEEQEQTIGRTKLTNLEINAPGSHVKVNTLTDADGDERRILRGAMPFGRPGHGEFGTYFIAYARDPEITETMLTRMYLGTAETGPDPLLDFSRAVTGTRFFVPSATFLSDLPAA
ncbi:Dyp-type peroxidase [Streptomyces sp. NPDC005017]|uniref:Dyp-type peroxidase n=1 Tax=Streptomyces sp. NPDC005017 TaxID=3364706 RepID=UPI0036BA3E0A